MSKMNNKGWGMVTFLLLIALLLCALLLVTYLSNLYGNGLPSSSRGNFSYHYDLLIG